MDNPICFFDSGIGGSTILKEVIKLLPNENYVYYADGINNPYGNKDKDVLFKIVDGIVIKLLKYNPKLIVCACNTATAMVLNDIRKKYPDVTFIGTEPAIKVAHDKYSDKNTVVLTTKGTGESERFKNLFNTYKTQNCSLVEAKDLAHLIETGKDTYPYLNDLLKDHKDAEVVVLGCTHFPLAIDNLKKVIPSATFIDGAVGIANRINSLIDKRSGTGNIKIISENQNDEERILSIIKGAK